MADYSSVSFKNNGKLKLLIIVGTRPEIIKMSPVIRECEKRGFEYYILHTGQHYSYEELARATGLREGTVKSKLNRAKSRLQELMEA